MTCPTRMVLANSSAFGHLTSLRGLAPAASVSNYKYQYMCKRYSSKRARLSKYFEPHVKKKHMLGACEPYYPKEIYLPEERCFMNKYQPRVEELVPLEKIYAEELKQKLVDNDLVLILHRNYLHHEQTRLFRNALFRANGTLEIFNNKIYKYAFGQLERNDLSRFLICNTAILVGRSEKLPDYLTALKKVPQLILLAGHLEGRYLVNRDQLVKMAQTVDLDLGRAYLCNTLDLHAMELSRILSSAADSGRDSSDEGSPI